MGQCFLRAPLFGAGLEGSQSENRTFWGPPPPELETQPRRQIRLDPPSGPLVLAADRDPNPRVPRSSGRR